MFLDSSVEASSDVASQQLLPVQAFSLLGQVTYQEVVSRASCQRSEHLGPWLFIQSRAVVVFVHNVVSVKDRHVQDIQLNGNDFEVIVSMTLQGFKFDFLDLSARPYEIKLIGQAIRRFEVIKRDHCGGYVNVCLSCCSYHSQFAS